MLSINPDAATRDDVARLAAELMDANHDLLVARSRIAELEKDARRYRWLRNNAIHSETGPWCVAWDDPGAENNNDHPCDLEELDTAIDAALSTPQPEPSAELIERVIEALAELEHEQWMAWAKSVAHSEPFLTEGRKERWVKAMVPYSMLTEAQKEDDRLWARKVIAVLALAERREGMVLVPREGE